MACYKFAMNDFSGWYLESVKPLYGEKIDKETLAKVTAHFETLLKLLHPLMPFITEEIWHNVAERPNVCDALVVAPWPKAKAYDEAFLKGFETATELVTQIRNVRKQNNIPNKVAIELFGRGTDDAVAGFYPVVTRLTNISEVHLNGEMPSQAFTFVQGRMEYAIPFGDTINAEDQVAKLIEERDYTQGFLKSVQKKLSNERFVNNAPPAVIDSERKKEADALSKISMIEEKLQALGA
jgi:valyl-tRNA synthetase